MSLKRFKVEKLIRDNLPDIMREKGIEVHDRFMDEEEFLVRLKDKLLEEAAEVKQSSTVNELVEELGDTLEVLLTIANSNGITMEQIEQARIAKRDAKGGFDKKIYNRFVAIEDNNPAINYYLERPGQYPLICDPVHQSDCLFCQFIRGDIEVKFLEKFSHCYAIQDQFPVSNGHILIIPNEHTENWFTAREEVRLDMINALNDLKSRLDLEYRPNGYNIGANCGEVAGQSVMHLHLHLIPRYQGDMENPKGGVRGVIPSKQKY
jgi:diadenosine tetraphosphate (Ap4A) HIT family hydrolase/predicted house-cleaning noncanonical NTP pyrophosphatase (MazG superfamily)